MTSYDLSGLLKYAKLSNLAPKDLDINDEEKIKKYLSFFKKEDFNNIISMINEDLEVDVTGIDHNLEFFNDFGRVERDDNENYKRNSKEDLLKTSKNQNGDYYISPKIIE